MKYPIEMKLDIIKDLIRELSPENRGEPIAAYLEEVTSTAYAVAQELLEELQNQEIIEVEECGEDCPFYRITNYTKNPNPWLESHTTKKLGSFCAKTNNRGPHNNDNNFPDNCPLFDKSFTVKIK